MFIIRELKINDDDITGVQAISFVENPAIETDFEYFAKQTNIIRSVSDIFPFIELTGLNLFFL